MTKNKKPKIIVIGNAPVNQMLGSKVDEFDVVIRVNDFKTGYEEYIGSRTDIISIGCPVEVNNKFNCDVWGCFPLHSKDKLFNDMYRFYGDRLQEVPKMALEGLYKITGYKYSNLFPTTGIATIAVARWVSTIPIHVLGFNLNNTIGKEGQTLLHIEHTSEDVEKINKTANVLESHNYERDREYYDNLIKSGDIIELGK